MIVKTIVHGLIAAGVIAGAGAIWTEVSYAQSGYTATPNAGGSYSWGPATTQGRSDDTGYVEGGRAGDRDDDRGDDRDGDRDDDGDRDND